MTSAIQNALFPLDTVNPQKESLFLSKFPSEIFFGIMRDIGEQDVKDLIKSRLICKKLCLYVVDSGLLQTIFKQHFPFRPLPSPIDFKGTYRELNRISSNVANGVYRLTAFKCDISYSSICAFLVSEKSLITGGFDARIRLFSFETESLKIIEDTDRIAAFAIDNEMLFSFYLDQSVKCWNMKTWESLSVPSIGADACTKLIVSGEKLISGFADGRIEMREVKTRSLLDALPGQGHAVQLLAASREKLVSLFMVEKNQALVKIWDLKSKECLCTWNTFAESNALDVLTFDGEKLFTNFTGGNEILSWDIATGNCLRIFERGQSGVAPVAILGNRLISYTGDQKVTVWDIVEGKHLKDISCYGEEIESMQVVGERLFLCTHLGTIHLWDFQAEDSAIVEEIKIRFGLPLEDIYEPITVRNLDARRPGTASTLERFYRMPKKLQEQILPPIS